MFFLLYSMEIVCSPHHSLGAQLIQKTHSFYSSPVCKMTAFRIVIGMSSLLFVFTMLQLTIGAPVPAEETFFDQRQNGSQNFRVNLDGLVVVHVPSSELTSLVGALPDYALEQPLFHLLNGGGSSDANNPEEAEKPAELIQAPSSTGAPATRRPQVAGEQQPTRKPAKKPGQRLRFANLLPLLRQA